MLAKVGILIRASSLPLSANKVVRPRLTDPYGTFLDLLRCYPTVMATLKSEHGPPVVLSAEHLVGRSSAAHTQLVDPAVSGQHAVIRWVGHTWHIRDLGSRNGTWVDGSQIPVDTFVPLALGCVVWFGGAQHAFTFVDASPPAPSARDGQTLVRGDATLLALPSEDDPEVVVTFEPDAGWTLSTESDTRPVSDGDRIGVGEHAFILSLPQPVAPTVEASTPEGGRSLRFQVSADEEYVELTATLGSTPHRLPPRAHHYLLLVLARARLADAAEGVAEAEQGWVYTSSLADQLRITMNRLYVTLHRCRKELGALDADAEHTVIEKRVTTRQVRLGWTDLEVSAL